MAKPREISSVEAGLSLAIKNNKNKVLVATGKSESYLRKCSDPNLPQQLDHKDAIKIDRVCIEAGLMPYLFEAHKAIIISELKKIKGSELVNKDHPKVLEIWNLVFIQFNRKKDGSLQKLDKQYVDTGMGLERLCMALQKKNSTYETDLFSDIIKEVENISKKKYLARDEKIDVGIRVISDHLRAIVFTILDGQIPSNTGPGYVMRRIVI